MFRKIKAFFAPGKLEPEEFLRRLQTAKAALTVGDVVAAEQLSRRLLEQVTIRNGADSAATADVEFFRGRVWLAAGDKTHALEALERATYFDARTEDETKKKLTYEMNLGDMLEHVGELSRAEAVLTKSLDHRLKYYGLNHAGYGYGATSLGTVQLRLGKFAEAKQSAEAAVSAFEQYDNDERWESAMALWLLASTGAVPDEPVFSKLPGAVRSALAPKLAVGGKAIVAEWLPLLWEVYGQLKNSGNDDGERTCLATLINTAESLDRHEDRVRALEFLVEKEQAHSVEAHGLAMQSLALAFDQAGRQEEAREAYDRAVEVLTESNDDAAKARCFRNLGTFFVHHGDNREATETLGEALKLVDKSGSKEEGRVTTALGIHLHQDGEWDRAASLLRTSIELLPSTHADHLMAASHLPFALKHAPYESGSGMKAALEHAIREKVGEYVPPTLIGKIVMPARGTGEDIAGEDIGVHVTRQPTEDEEAQIKLAIADARKLIAASWDTTYGPRRA